MNGTTTTDQQMDRIKSKLNIDSDNYMLRLDPQSTKTSHSPPSSTLKLTSATTTTSSPTIKSESDLVESDFFGLFDGTSDLVGGGGGLVSCATIYPIHKFVCTCYTQCCCICSADCHSTFHTACMINADTKCIPDNNDGGDGVVNPDIQLQDKVSLTNSHQTPIPYR